MNIVHYLRHLVAALVSFLTGVPELTPRQKARLVEIEKEQAGSSPAGFAEPQAGSSRKL